jgi:glutamyl-tRNA(Gln) amidotransferase subunit D
MATDSINPQHSAILAEIQLLAKQMPVVAAPQTIFGRIDMKVYTPGRQLLDAGVLGNGLDMTPETAFVKLAWLLSNVPKKDIARMYSENLRGELSERSGERGFL